MNYKRRRAMKRERIKSFFKVASVITVLVLCILMAVDVVKYPECYFSTWKQALYYDIEAGDEEAIEYYNRVYVANGRELFEEE